MLKDELATLKSKRQKDFLVMRIAGMDKRTSLVLLQIPEGTLKRWSNHPEFKRIYSQIIQYNNDYKEEAIRLLRKDNQLAAVLLEREIIQKLRKEIEEEKYSLVRTHLGREVYSRLISELDHQPTTQVLTWEQRIYQETEVKELPQSIEGEIVSNTQMLSAGRNNEDIETESSSET